MAIPLTKRHPTHALRRADGTEDYRPMYVVWEITLRCDQACHFCGSRPPKPGRRGSGGMARPTAWQNFRYCATVTSVLYI